jgi:catechol 2,3-dioxygenase-like lactoylglutathione lyase family enzyme
MDLQLQHVELHVSSLKEAKDFYVTKLGLELLEERPELNLFAVKAGGVRLSVFGGYERTIPSKKATGTHLILRTSNLEETIATLKKRGVVLDGEIFEAPGFIRDIVTEDPDGNVIEIAQYLRDPLKPQA